MAITTYGGMTYTQHQVGIKESIVDELLLLDPRTTPFISLLGFGEPITNIKHEWIEDEMWPQQTLINTSGGTLNDSTTSIVVDDVSPFLVNSIAKIGNELVKITAIDPETKTLTVVRGYASTTKETSISDDTPIKFAFVEGVEGFDARAARATKREIVDNYTQIFDESITVTNTALAIDQWAMGNYNQYEYNRQKALVSVASQLESAIVDGIKYNNGNVRQMRGIRSFISTNVTQANNTELSLTMFSELAQKIYNTGAFKSGSARYIIMVPPAQKTKVSALDDSKITIERADGGRGQVVDRIYTDFGVFDVIMNDNLNPDELFLLDLNRIKIRPLRGREFSHTFLGTKGDYQSGFIVGEYTLEFKQEKAHGRITGLKTS